AVNVGREAEYPAISQDTREPVQVDRADEAPLPVTLLLPRVRVEEVDTCKRPFRQPVKQPCSVVIVEPQVRAWDLIDLGDELCHAVDERLDADEAGVGIAPRFIVQMF